MLPWNYGFHWNTATFIFMGAFYTVLAIVGFTLLKALLRSRTALDSGKEVHIQWHSDFEDLTKSERTCRHVFTGDFQSRACPNGFDCRQCATHAKLVAAKPAETYHAGEEDVLGLPYPTDRFYHRGHTWVRYGSDGRMTIGLDALGERLLGNPDSVQLPMPGEQVHVNGTAWQARKRGASVRVLCPVDGEVVETGGPGENFYLKVKPRGLDVRHLLCGPEIALWAASELERLQLTFSAEAGAPALADGGELVSDVSSACPERSWDSLCARMFLNT